jgi:thiosulfate/3-mercaptopyruvate sulfurtransferase
MNVEYFIFQIRTMDSSNQQQVPIFIRAETLHKYNKVKFIDVRDSEAYFNGHIDGAVHANDFFTYLLRTSTAADTDQMRAYFQNRLGELGISGDEHVIFYEQSMDNQYGASCRGFFILKYMNHPKVSTLEGGFDAFVRMENSTQYITKDAPVPTPCHYRGQSNDEDDWSMVGRDEVLQIVTSKPPKKWLLDVRDAIEWNGLSSSPYGVDFAPRKGRIPNAVWIEWYTFHELDKDRNLLQLKTNEQIQALVEEKGIDKDDEIIVYCFKGSRAAVALMKLKQAGYNNCKNYFASWNEWSRDPQLPIDDMIIENSQV